MNNTDRVVKPYIADAILTAQILRLLTARDAYEYYNGRQVVSNERWEGLKDEWEWHFSLPKAELKAAVRSS